MKQSQDFRFRSITVLGILTQASPDGRVKAIPFFFKVFVDPLTVWTQESTPGANEGLTEAILAVLAVFSGPRVTDWTSSVCSPGGIPSIGATDCTGAVVASTIEGLGSIRSEAFAAAGRSMVEVRAKSVTETVDWTISEDGEQGVIDAEAETASFSVGTELGERGFGFERDLGGERFLGGFLFPIWWGGPEIDGGKGFRRRERRRRTTEKEVTLSSFEREKVF